MLWNKAAFQRLEIGHSLSPGSAGMGWRVWHVDVSCAWPYSCILSGLGSERMLSFSRGQALLLLMDLCAKYQRTPVVERISSRLSMVFSLPVEIPSEKSVQDAKKLAEAAEMVSSWLSHSREKGWELASSPRGLWLDTP